MSKITLGIVSPSRGPAKYFPQRLQKAIQNAQQLGFEVKFMKYALGSNGYVSDTPQHRAQDLMQAFADPEVDIVMSMIGGNHSNQILKYVDWEVIKNNPKPFVGYSDITVLHHALRTQAGLQTYYGPAFITQFGDIGEGYQYTFEYFQKVVIKRQSKIEVKPSSQWTDDFVDWGEQNPRPKKFVKNQGWHWLQPGKAIAPISGGCVPCINHLLGTKYLMDWQDKIFFVDIPEDFCGPDKGFDIANLDAFLADLDNVGVFDGIKGLIVGRPFRYSQQELEHLEEMIKYYTQDKDYPVLIGVDLGHTDPMITIPYLSKVKLDSHNDEFVMNY